MNAIVPFQQGGPAALFQSKQTPSMVEAAQQGLSGGFAVIKYKGSKWAIRYQGDTEILTAGEGPAAPPLPFLDVVVVGVSPHIAKTYYAKRYAEGDDAAPTCMSMDGKTPDASSELKQSASCATCPQNVFGSRVSENGKRAKACQDNRVIAVVPLEDLKNESYGGPMMLRIPPMSLANLAAAGRTLQRYGGDFPMVGMRIGFDYTVAYPLLTFTPLGWLTDAQAKDVLEVIEDPRVDQILRAPVDAGEPAPVEASPLAQGGPPAGFAPQPAAVAVQQPAPVQAPAPVAAQQPAQQFIPIPVNQPAPAPAQAAPAAAPAKRGGFGRSAAAAPAAQPAPQPAVVDAAAVVQAQPAADVPPPAATTTVVTAGDDLESMVNSLLS